MTYRKKTQIKKNRIGQNRTEQEVLSIYQKVNPSTYPIETDMGEYNRRMDFMENLFFHRLNFPPKMFNNATLLEFGSGTGENSLFYLRSGASCTFVEVNPSACQRADKLFQTFAPKSSKYQILNKSLFDFSSDELFDIVISLGVIHHTANKDKAFYIKSKYLKKGGFFVLGIGNSAGHFQRNLQRTIIYHFAKSEEEIVSLAEELFSEHLDRAEKFGGRDRKAIIYDTYLNPKVDTPSISEVLNWFSMNDLRLYSSWPPIIPAVLGDPPDRKPIQLENLYNVMSIPELVYLAHSADDTIQLMKFEKEIKTVIAPFKELANLLNNLTPDIHLKLNHVISKISALQAARIEFNPFTLYISRLMNLLNETKSIIELLQEDRIDNVKKCIKNMKYLFKGTCGLGMTWYIGYKNL